MTASRSDAAPILALVSSALLCAGCLSFQRGAMPGEPADATFATVRGARVRYVVEGEGSPVVLLHGYASSLETWDTVRPALRERHRVVSLDLKGFGWTDRPPGDYSPEEQARLVLALMDELHIERAALVGHSYGASVALAVALAAPDRVSRLALYDAWVYEDQLPSFFHWARADGLGEVLFGAFYDQRPDERLERAFYDPDAVSEELVEAVERAMERPGTRAAALATARGMRYARLEGRYGTVEQPVLLLWGREDAVTPVEVGERLLRELPNAAMQVFPRCGHFPMIEASRASARVLGEFLAEDVVAVAEPTPPVVAPRSVADDAPDAAADPSSPWPGDLETGEAP